MKSLSPRQQKFCQHYAQTGIAETAAIAAGYSKRTARGSATRLLANAGIQQELARLAKATESEAIADLQGLRIMWTSVLRNEDLPMVERLRASELLGKSLGAFITRNEHSGPGGTPLAAPVVNLTLTHKPEREVFPQPHKLRTIPQH